MAVVNAKFSTKTVGVLPSANRQWGITIPVGTAIWASIDGIPAGNVKKQIESALLQGGQIYNFQSTSTQVFLSVFATDPAADAAPIPITFVDAGPIVPIVLP